MEARDLMKSQTVMSGSRGLSHSETTDGVTGLASFAETGTNSQSTRAWMWSKGEEAGNITSKRAMSEQSSVDYVGYHGVAGQPHQHGSLGGNHLWHLQHHRPGFKRTSAPIVGYHFSFGF